MKRTGIKRSTKRMTRKPMQRKPTKAKSKPRKGTAPRCISRSCPQPQRVLDRCRKHAVAKADELASAYVKQRDGRCVCCEVKEGTMTWAHIIRRNNGRWVRHAKYGAVTLCWPCHTRFTHDEAAWVDFLDEYKGPCFHKRLRLIRNKQKYDNFALERTLTMYGYVPAKPKTQ